jgi:predicted RNase H-like HicB family nuclease
MKLVYPACFYPDSDGSYTVVVPDLKGCVTFGKDFAEAIDMAVDAASGWILKMIYQRQVTIGRLRLMNMRTAL